MGWTDTILIFVIIAFGVILIWSAFQKQRIIDTLTEIKEFITSMKEGE